MALADILERIAADASVEAKCITDDADSQAALLLAEAQAAADAAARDELDAGLSDARAEAQRRLAAARLAARDERLAASDALIAETLAGVEHALGDMDDAAYLRFIAQRVACVAASGERLALASADAGRLAGLATAVRALGGPELVSIAEAADIPAGALLVGDRTRVEISPRAAVVEEHDALVLRLAALLFGERKD